jgi:hypothetical protein
MKEVGKYNTFKGISTLLTIGTPIITLACCGDFFVERPATAISAAGVFAILIALLFAKDKLAEKIKTPSAFIISAAVLVIIVVVENIILPMKYVCIATMIASGVDELTFKRMYKALECKMPQCWQAYEHFGFIFAKTQDIFDEVQKEVNNNEEERPES